MERSSSPFPPPDLIAGYKEVMPGLEERLIALIEGQNKHRQSMEKKEQDAEIEDTRERLKIDAEDMRANRLERYRGQWFGFALGALAIVGAVVAAALDKPLMGGLIGGGGVAALAGAFVYARYQRDKKPPAGSP